MTVRADGDDALLRAVAQGDRRALEVGVGFDPSTVRRGVSMAERIEALGGSLHVRSSPGRGTVVAARLPLAR